MKRLTIPDAWIDRRTMSVHKSVINADEIQKLANQIYWRLKTIEDVIADLESEEYDLVSLRELAQAGREGDILRRNTPMSIYPDGDSSVEACQMCGSGEYLYNEDGNRNRYCGQCGQRLDWTTDLDRLHRQCLHSHY